MGPGTRDFRALDLANLQCRFWMNGTLAVDRRGGHPSGDPLKPLIDWANAWSNKDVTTYLAFYDPSFKPANVGRTKWFDNRKRLVTREGAIELRISNVQRRTLSPNLVETTFDQVYTSPNFKDQTQKVLQWKRTGNEWYIVKESNR